METVERVERVIYKVRGGSVDDVSWFVRVAKPKFVIKSNRHGVDYVHDLLKDGKTKVNPKLKDAFAEYVNKEWVQFTDELVKFTSFFNEQIEKQKGALNDAIKMVTQQGPLFQPRMRSAQLQLDLLKGTEMGGGPEEHVEATTHLYGAHVEVRETSDEDESASNTKEDETGGTKVLDEEGEEADGEGKKVAGKDDEETDGEGKEDEETDGEKDEVVGKEDEEIDGKEVLDEKDEEIHGSKDGGGGGGEVKTADKEALDEEGEETDGEGKEDEETDDEKDEVVGKEDKETAGKEVLDEKDEETAGSEDGGGGGGEVETAGKAVLDEEGEETDAEGKEVAGKDDEETNGEGKEDEMLDEEDEQTAGSKEDEVDDVRVRIGKKVGGSKEDKAICEEVGGRQEGEIIGKMVGQEDSGGGGTAGEGDVGDDTGKEKSMEPESEQEPEKTGLKRKYDQLESTLQLIKELRAGNLAESSQINDELPDIRKQNAAADADIQKFEADRAKLEIAITNARGAKKRSATTITEREVRLSEIGSNLIKQNQDVTRLEQVMGDVKRLEDDIKKVTHTISEMQSKYVVETGRG